MACNQLIRDADNKWQVSIDWSAWKTDQSTLPSGVTGLTITLLSAVWVVPAGITEEVGTQLIGDVTYFVGTGGTNGSASDLLCTITYSATQLSVTDLTQDQTITVNFKNQ